MKTPEELCKEWCKENLDIATHAYCYGAVNLSFLAGYQAAKEHAHAELEEADVEIDRLQTKLSDAGILTTEHLIDASKTVSSSETLNNWISVKDRLPEIEEIRDDYKRSKAVLWIAHDKDIMVGYQLTIGDRTRVMTGFSEPRIENFTHWMPLPKSPEE
jgi:hypothetical protein